tara:strand:- start:788 stop:1168 length:381 start_codon:yes stop_codon:yes gene_type:complete
MSIKMKKFYLYGFDMQSPMRNTPKAAPGYYDVTNKDLRFGFTEDWEGRQKQFDDVYKCKRHNKSHAILLTAWDTDLDRKGMMEIKKAVKDELKKDFVLKGDTIKDSVDQNDRIISWIENVILFLQG